MYSRVLTICLATMLIASCVTRGSVPVVVDTACDWVKPIYLTDHDIGVLDRQTKKDILTHNKAPQYTITTGTIPEFEADSGEIIPAYTGLIAYSESLEHGVLQLDD